MVAEQNRVIYLITQIEDHEMILVMGFQKCSYDLTRIILYCRVWVLGPSWKAHY